MTFVYMKHLMTMNEMVKNPKLIEFYINKIRDDFEFLNTEIRVRKFTGSYELSASDINKKYFNLVKKILNNYKKIFLKMDYILGFRLFDHNTYYYLSANIKNSKTKRIKPERFVYHYSPQYNREEIMKNGLIPQKFSDSNSWSDTPFLEYEDAIFAMNGTRQKWHHLKNADCWEIDTLNLKNKWWEDLNLEDNLHIMTFEPIPKEYLKLVKYI